MPLWYAVGVPVLFGLVVGSFLNVVICRLPLEQSVVSPGSRCPRCQTAIRWYDNVPLLGWLWLGAKCRACKAPISPEYPLVEAANGLLWGALAWRFGWTPALPVYLLLASSLLTLTVIDLHHQILPDRITLPGIVVGLVASATLLPVGFVGALSGAVLGAGLYLAIVVLSRGGMGGGDVKLIAMIGAFMGWQAVLLTTVLAATTGSLVGVVLMVAFGKGRKHAVPFGPFLALGALFHLFWGAQVIDWYLGLGRP
ncbi:MAG: prepilin peptidase [Nitrospirota bacterium]|nr:prepilin peptidase [Nitrospirota bacterium]